MVVTAGWIKVPLGAVLVPPDAQTVQASLPGVVGLGSEPNAGGRIMR